MGDNQQVTQKSNTGYTLIEITLVIVIMGLIAMIGVPLIYEASRSTTISTQLANASAQGQFALQQMSREIREVRANSPASIFFPTTTSFTFINSSDEQIRYQYSNGTLTVQTPVGTGVLADNIQSFSLGYYTQDGILTSSASSMRYIKVNITLNVGTTGELPLQSIIYLRNSV